MYEVVPKHYLNKYGGVFTSEIRDNRRRKKKRQGKSGNQTVLQLKQNKVGNPRPMKNPNKSNKEKQSAAYASMFSTYGNNKKIKNSS